MSGDEEIGLDGSKLSTLGFLSCFASLAATIMKPFGLVLLRVPDSEEQGHYRKHDD
jgi:hypothetical protein